MIKILLFAMLTVAACLAGCETTTFRPYSDAYQADIATADRGNLDAAAVSLMRKISQGDIHAMVVLGLLYVRYDKRKEGIALLTLAARKGNGNAQQMLAQLGEPVPQADLAVRRATSTICSTVGGTVVCTSN